MRFREYLEETFDWADLPEEWNFGRPLNLAEKKMILALLKVYVDPDGLENEIMHMVLSQKTQDTKLNVDDLHPDLELKRVPKPKLAWIKTFINFTRKYFPRGIAHVDDSDNWNEEAADSVIRNSRNLAKIKAGTLNVVVRQYSEQWQGHPKTQRITYLTVWVPNARQWVWYTSEQDQEKLKSLISWD